MQAGMTRQTQADRKIRIEFSFGKEVSFITSRVHASISLHHVFSFAFASHAGKNENLPLLNQEAGKNRVIVNAASLVEL